MKALATVLAAAGLLLGVLVGYVLWGEKTRDLQRELGDLQRREAAEKRRADDLHSRMSEVEAQLKKLTDDLTAERELRNKYERLVSKGRK